jgi:Na+/H+-dicarboxylate symporter
VLRKVPGAVWGLLALALGMLLGSAYPDALAPVSTGVSTVFKWVAAAAPYIIFFTISAAVIDMLRSGHAGRFALAVSVAFVLIGLFASLLAIVLVVPLFRLPWTGGGATASLVAPGESFGQVVAAHLTPSLMAVLYAIATSVLLQGASRVRALAWATRPTLDVVRLVGVEGIALVGRGIKAVFPLLLFAIGIFVPTSVGRAIDASAKGIGSAARFDTAFGSHPIGLYLLTVYVQVLVFLVFMVVATVSVCAFAGFPIKRFLRDYFAFVYPFAWATSSSAASIPVNLEYAEELGVRKEVRDFVIPLGATVNLDGAIMACFIITPMAAMLVGYRPSAVDLLLLVIPIKLVTMGVPGIPGGIAVVVPPVVADLLPIPPEQRAAFLAIWFGFSVGLSDMFRTGVNTTTNGLVAILFDKLYPKHFAKRDVAAGTEATAEDAAPTEA